MGYFLRYVEVKLIDFLDLIFDDFEDSQLALRSDGDEAVTVIKEYLIMLGKIWEQLFEVRDRLTLDKRFCFHDILSFFFGFILLQF